jgi:DNA-binding NarL/FixJ family response regulator
MSGALNRFDLNDGWHRRGRVVIGLDNRLLAESLASALAQRGWTVEGVSTAAPAVLQQAALYAPDICVLSTSLPGAGTALAATIARTVPHTRAVVLGTLDGPARSEARAAGVAAVISEDHPMSVVAEVLDRVADGEVVTDLTATVVPLRRPARGRSTRRGEDRLAPLTSRERQVLALLAEGSSTTAMADEMGVSAATVRSHIQSVFTKLGVHSRLRAVAIYRTEQSDTAVQAV